MVSNPQGDLPCPELGDEWRYLMNTEGAFVDQNILEIQLGDDGRIQSCWIDVRPIPEEDHWFENIWNDFRNDRIIR